MRITGIIMFLVVCQILPALYAQGILINEVMPKNETTIQDEDGDYPDWFELYNPGSSVVNLKDYSVADDSCCLQPWIFPDCIVPPKGMVFVFASGKDRVEGPFFHTNFKLDSDGEYLIIHDSNGNVADSLQFGDMDEDISYGRKPDGGEDFFYFDYPTPATTNNLSNSLYFSHPAGFYTGPFKLLTDRLDQQDSIHYTVDGSIPGPDDPVCNDSLFITYRYDDPNVFSEIPTNPDTFPVSEFRWQPPMVNIEKANVLRFRSYRGASPTSKVYSMTFFVDSLVFERFPYPVISLITDPASFFDFDTGIYVPGVNWDPEDMLWTGNYYMKGDEWERDVHIEYFEQSGEEGFSQDAGVRIHGKRSRRRPQKTLRMYARKEYGKAQFEYKLFPHRDADKFDRFLLTTTLGSQEATIIEDVVAHDIVRPTGIEISEYRPAILFVNGEYWGIHTIREYQDEHYLEELFGLEKDSIDLLTSRWDIVHGSNTEYKDLAGFIEENDLSVPLNYEYVSERIDIGNFIDYQISEIFLRNYDWPGSNIKFWKSREPESRWRWIFFDLDMGFYIYDYDMMIHATEENGPGWPNPPWSTLFLRKLLLNEDFKSQFIDRFAFLLNTIFQTDTIRNRIGFFTDVYDAEIERHIERWNYPKSRNNWLNSVNNVITEFVIERPCYMREHILDFFDLTEFGFECDTVYIGEKPNIEFNLFPNPSRGIFNIELPAGFQQNLQYRIFDAMGTEVRSGWLSMPSERIHFDVSGLPRGLYYLKLEGNGLNWTDRFILSGR